MLAALIQGERDPKRLAELARTRLRAKRSQLEEACTGQFTGHHGFLLATMLGRIDQASADSAELDRKLEAEITTRMSDTKPNARHCSATSQSRNASSALVVVAKVRISAG
jgi:hypothetical protein